MTIELIMLSHHLILCCPLFLLPSILPSISVLSILKVKVLVAKSQLSATPWTVAHQAPLSVCRGVRGEGPSAVPVLLLVHRAPFSVLCMYVMYVQQQGVQYTQGPPGVLLPDPSLRWVPLPVPLSCGEILPCGAWAGPSLCQHCHLGPNQDLTAPLRAGACHPNGG